WDPASKKYVYYPGDEYAGFNPPIADASRSVTSAPAGLGYWINLTTDTPVHINGDQLETESYRIPLQTGWNMIGNPFTFAVDWNGIQVEYQGKTETLAEAIDDDWIKDALYKYQSSGYTWETAPYGNMQPWEGYWVKAYYPVTLIVPPIESGIGSLEGASRSRAVAARNSVTDWRIRLSARGASGAADSYNMIGISRSARDDDDKGDVEKPPLPSAGTISLNIRNGGRSLAQDLKGPEVGTGKTWLFDVTTDLKQEQITVQWPDMSQLPSTLEACLEDQSTGRKIYTRTSGGYTYNSGQGGTRSFKLTVAPRRTSTLMVTDLSVMRTRGVPSVHFNLSREAVVTVSLVDPTGKVQRNLAVEQAATAGVNAISTGRADGLAPGLYLVQVTATASDGVSVRATRPLVVVR
ncbi:MAG TPA: hypothetical protein VHR86_09410, partial [Armatimonadota bacterium]|nr:hypothetical protein [Armatimonadota bacterium]